MDKEIRFGSNLQALRKRYGFTQDDLGFRLSWDGKTISKYERGKSEPGYETLSKIAKQFGVTVDQLFFDDLSYEEPAKPFNIFDFVGHNILTIFPLFIRKEYERDFANATFYDAYIHHAIIIDAFLSIKSDDMQTVEYAVETLYNHYSYSLDSYINVYKECEDYRSFLAPNYLALWTLVLGIKTMMHDNVEFITTGVAKEFLDKDPILLKKIEYLNDDDIAEIKKELEVIPEDRYVKWENYLMYTLKRSSESADLADYYLSLQYLLNIVRNDLGMALNRQLGIELFEHFRLLGNPYNNRLKKKFLEFSET